MIASPEKRHEHHISKGPSEGDIGLLRTSLIYGPYVELSDPIKIYLPDSPEDCNIRKYLEAEGFKGRGGLCKQLLPKIHQDKHNPYYQKLIEYIPQAIPRAKQLGDCTPTGSNYPQHVCTNIHKLVEKLVVMNCG